MEEITSQDMPENFECAVGWLEKKSTEMIHASRRKMENGITAFPPQVGSGYEAFWLRDYAYMLEGNIDAFSKKELKDACLLFVNAQSEDGAMVDCIKFDGTPIYKPGMGNMGINPVADGSQFTIGVVWHTYRKTKDESLVKEVIDRLVRCMEVVPRNPKTGPVYIKPGEEWDRCPYGFTDTIRKQGDTLFDSLLFVQASRQLADLLKVAGRENEARQWQDEAIKVAESIRKIFWDSSIGLFRASTVKCKQSDIWGSAFAVYLNVATGEQSLAIADYFRKHYNEIVKRGQLRHLPAGIYWELTDTPKEKYQNGAYWATPIGWFAYTLDLIDHKLADQTVMDMVRDFIKFGVNECINDNYVAVRDYIASTALPLAGIRTMVWRRKSK